MDGDPAVEPELDSFSLSFPLPYRVGFIIVLAIWGWGLNLHHLRSLGVNVPELIRYPARSNPSQPPHHLSTYRLASVLSALFALSISVFWLLTRRDPSRVLAYDWLPMTFLSALFASFFLPLKSLSAGGRARTLKTLRRVSVGGIAEARDGKFGDILLADVLTSYAKVLGDLFVSACMFLTAGRSATAHPDRGCGGTIVVPLIMALPSAVRLRQCLTEYLRVRRRPARDGGWGGQHLANAAKYATAFPVIVLSALLRGTPAGSAGGTALYRGWLLAVAANSLYSFYWDVAKDWDLSLFSGARERAAPDQPFGLRKRLLWRPNVYYIAIALDLLLRCTWSLKLSPHLDRVSDFESSIFLVELLEVVRRWGWIFFRVETEWIRSGPVAGPGLGLAPDDILLGDYDKYEDDD